MVVQCMLLCALSFPLQVWFVDGTVKCFTGGHIPLALWAIFCLLLCVAAIFVPLIGLRHRKPEEVSVHIRMYRMYLLESCASISYNVTLQPSILTQCILPYMSSSYHFAYPYICW